MIDSAKRQVVLEENDNVLSVRGDVDFANVGRLLRRLNRLRGSYRTVVVDLSGVSYMDSAGFGTLLRACRELRHSGGQLILRHPSAHIRRMLQVTDTLRFFGVEEERSLAPRAAAQG